MFTLNRDWEFVVYFKQHIFTTEYVCLYVFVSMKKNILSALVLNDFCFISVRIE